MTVSTLRRLVVMVAVASVLVACGFSFHSPSQRVGPPTLSALSGLAAPADPSPDAAWRLSSTRALFAVVGRPSSVLFVALPLSSSCGRRIVALNGTRQSVPRTGLASTTITLDESGEAGLVLDAPESGCRERTAPPSPVVVGRPVLSVLGPSGAPWVLPAEGFAPPEQVDDRSGWWMTSPRGHLEVHGKSGADVIVRVTLSPTPCGPARAALGQRTYDLATPQPLVLRVRLDRAGTAQIPVSVASPSCAAPGDTRTLYLMAFDPEALMSR